MKDIDKIVGSIEEGGDITRQGYLPDSLYQLMSHLPELDINVVTPKSDEIRLSKGAKIHIRRLKQEGMTGEAERFARHSRESKQENLSRQDRARAMLLETVEVLIDEKDRIKEAVGGIKVVWLANASGIIDDDRRYQMVGEIYGINEAYEEKISEAWEKVREDVSGYMPKP